MQTEERRRYLREYYLKNRDRIRERNRAWRAANRDKVRAANRRWNAKRLDEFRKLKEIFHGTSES